MGAGGMTKANMKILDRAFDLETRGGLLQSKSKRVKQLAIDGYLEPVKYKEGTGWLAVTIEGYKLTHKGRWAYCETCK